MDSDVSSAGRGRGRGRGGVPVLPEGMWDALQGSNDKAASVEEADESAPENHQDDSIGVVDMPIGFGRGRGGGRGGRGFGKAAGRGRGLVKDAKGKDWDCPSCSNVNWSWRSTCNKCGTAKPASLQTEDEVRDGAGGGFNERQGRMSAAAVEIDEEGFDDFGRRVKKSDRADKKAKEEAALRRMKEKYQYLNPTGSGGGYTGTGSSTSKDTAEEIDKSNSNKPKERNPSSSSSSNAVSNTRDSRDKKQVDRDSNDMRRSTSMNDRERDSRHTHHRESTHRRDSRDRQDRFDDGGTGRSRGTGSTRDDSHRNRDASRDRNHSNAAGDRKRDRSPAGATTDYPRARYDNRRY
mmetsp:Transcript_2544/g.4455  ORF Transcript_2544/g.4455 Transcript_2544/m.4455 type:complete len:350 (+) Transcript_2544:43-1092(+)